MSNDVTEVDIALGVLDHQLVDADGQNCGKVDDLEIAGVDGDSPEVVEILVGGNAWRSRGRLGRLAARLVGQHRARALGGGRVGHVDRHAQALVGRAAPEPRRRPLGRADPEAAGLLMRLSELLNRKVVTESGKHLGRIHDVRGELVGGRLRVTGLAAGEIGILERFGIGTHGSGGPGQAKVHGHAVIPWERVVRVGAEVVVRDE